MNLPLFRTLLLTLMWTFYSGGLHAAAVSTPILQLQARPSATQFDVWVTSATANARIHYTLDGSEPDETDEEIPTEGFVTINGNVIFKAKAWDGNVSGTLTPSATKTAVYNGFGRVASGTAETFALTFDGRISGSGGNYKGALGNGTEEQSNIPDWAQHNATDLVRNVISVDGSASPSGAVDFTIAAMNDGTAWAWGYNGSGQLGQGTLNSGSYYPLQVSQAAGLPLTQVISVAAGTSSGYALDANGFVWAWGGNTYGQLGDGTMAVHSFAAQVKTDANTALSNIVAISAGGNHLLALDKDGYVWAVGRGTEKQLGDGVAANRWYAAKVLASETPANNYLAGVKSVAAMNNSSLVICADDTVWGQGLRIKRRVV